MIALPYRLVSTMAVGVAWGITIVEVVATTDPKSPPPARVIALGALLGEAATDESIGANLVG